MGKSLRGALIPDLPEGIREDFYVHAALELQRHAPWLFAAMFINSIIALFTGAEEAHWSVRYALPGLMAGYCAFSMLALRSDWDFANKPWRARKFLLDSSLSSCFGAVVCTVWCIASWLVAPVEARMHFPIILVMGALATAYCLANIKAGAFANLAIDLIPISLLMMISGNSVEFAAAVSLLLAGTFQVFMIRSHHRRVIELLQLQQNARLQAQTDPLTGLSNRRALLEVARKHIPSRETMQLMLIDVDHFKAINDEFGHDTGDAVLSEIARIIADHAPSGTIAARIGGEEFALFGSASLLPDAVALGLLAKIRTSAMPHDRQVTASIGMAQARMTTDESWRSLFAAADSALYEAKNSGRNRYAGAALSADGSAQHAIAQNGEAVPVTSAA